MNRTTKLVTISLPPTLLREAEKVAKKEQRTTSELFREALRHYIATREGQAMKKEEAKKRIFALIEKNWRFNRGVPTEVIEQEVEEAVRAVRKKARREVIPSR